MRKSKPRIEKQTKQGETSDVTVNRFELRLPRLLPLTLSIATPPL